MRALTEREDRRLAKYIPAGPVAACWPWGGPMSSNGYGIFYLDRRALVAHRVVYQRVRGTLAADIVVDHLCRNPACVNLAHLQPVSQRVNTLRGVGPTAANALKTHCPKGHAYTTANTMQRRGKRECRQCRRDVRASRKQWRSGTHKTLTTRET